MNKYQAKTVVIDLGDTNITYLAVVRTGLVENSYRVMLRDPTALKVIDYVIDRVSKEVESDKDTLYCVAFDNCVFREITFTMHNNDLVLDTDCFRSIIKTEHKYCISFIDCHFVACHFETPISSYYLGRIEIKYSCTFTDCEGVQNRYISCPSHGEFIGWKTCNDYLVKLKIPAEAGRVSGTSQKCRCEFADVLAIYNLNDLRGSTKEIMGVPEVVVNSMFKGHKSEYVVGQRVYPDSYDNSKEKICTHGIHFYLDRDYCIHKYCIFKAGLQSTDYKEIIANLNKLSENIF